MEAWGDPGKWLAAGEELGKPNLQNRDVKSADQRAEFAERHPVVRNIPSTAHQIVTCLEAEA
jgi:hypothetical protein